jgi:hypothetical protein
MLCKPNPRGQEECMMRAFSVLGAVKRVVQSVVKGRTRMGGKIAQIYPRLGSHIVM